MTSRRQMRHLEFNIDPLVDVVFLLMAFFLFAFELHRAERIVLANLSVQQSNGQNQMSDDVPVYLRAGSAGQLARIDFADFTARDFASLHEMLEQDHRQHNHQTAIVCPDKSLAYRHVMETVRLFEADGWQVSLSSHPRSREEIRE